MTKSTLLSLIQSKFGHIRYTGNTDQITVNCPFCIKRGHSPDTRYKLSINIQKQIYHCYRCDARGNLSILFPQLEVRRIEPIISAESAEIKPLESFPEYQSLKLLAYPWDELVYTFLHDKNFDPVTLVPYDVTFTENYVKGGFSFGPRLLFPIFQGLKYKGFQARTIYKNTDPKYIGASGMLKGELLYNYDVAFSQKNMLVITEGFFDCLKVGDKAVATLGKNITQKQLRLIQLGSFDKVVVFLDRDAEKESYDNAKQLSAYFRTYIALPKWDELLPMPDGKKKKDPGDMTRTEVNETLNNNLERIY